MKGDYKPPYTSHAILFIRDRTRMTRNAGLVSSAAIGPGTTFRHSGYSHMAASAARLERGDETNVTRQMRCAMHTMI